MSALEARPRPRSPWLLACIALLGSAIGWSFRADQRLTFHKIYAVLSPLALCAVCVNELLRDSKHARWIVPASLALHVAGVVLHPHVPALTAIGITAAGIAIIATFRDHKPWAIAGVLLCYATISGSLVLGSPQVP